MGKGEFHEGEEKSAKRVVRKLVVWTGEQSYFRLSCWLQVSSRTKKDLSELQESWRTTE